MNKSKWWLLVLAVMLVGCQGGGAVTPAPVTVTPAPDVSAESYAVYNALIAADMAGGSLARVVIMDKTSTGYGDMEDQTAPASADPAAWKDYRVRNKDSQVLKAGLFKGALPVVLISKEEVSKIFDQESEDGWELFYQQYPDSQGIMTLSAVGFNASYTSAVVYMGNQSHWLAGAGYMVMLEKQNGRWVVKDRQMTWIS